MPWETWLALGAFCVSVIALVLTLINRSTIGKAVAEAASRRKKVAAQEEDVRSIDDADHHRTPDHSQAVDEVVGPIVVVVNPIKEDNLDAFKRLIAEVARETGGPEQVWLETTVEDPGVGQAKRAVEMGASLVIAAGGDGTVRAVVEGIAGTEVPVGIIPLGTGNLLVRNLDLPMTSRRDMVSAALTGHTRRMDVGFLSAKPMTEAERRALAEDKKMDLADAENVDVPAGEHAFAVIAGLGFDAAMVGDANADLKQKIGWVAYVVSAAKNMVGRKIKARVSAGEAQGHRIEARSIMFANCGKLPGGVVLAPDAQLDDGWLDLAVVDTKGGIVGWGDLIRRMALAGVGVRNDGLPQTGTIDFKRTRDVDVVTELPEMVQVDGDVLGYATRIHARLEHGGLLVRTL